MSVQDTIDVIQQSALSDEDKAKLSRLMRLIAKSSSTMDAAELREAREAAGLSLSQAAKLIGVHPGTLEWWEQSKELDGLSPHWATKVDEVYGLGRANGRTL